MTTKNSSDAPLAAFIRPGILFSVALAFITVTAIAKRVVCVDGCNTAFVNNHEGYERSLTNGTTDIVSVGGDLTACLSNVMSGDTLVIVAHGTGGGTGFIWGGMTFTNFGTNAGSMPLPNGFGSLSNVTIRFCSCWSTSTNVTRSMAQKLLDNTGGGTNGNSAAGFNDYSIASVCFSVSGGTATNRQAAINCLKMMPAWMGNPPVNRTPAATPNQQSAAQTVVDNCPGAGGVSNLMVRITRYKVPYNSTNAAPGAGNGSIGCGCAGSDPFCGIAEAIVEPPVLDIAHCADPSCVELSWPAEFGDFFLESKPSLNGGPFNPHSGLVVADEQRLHARNMLTAEPGFFRLRSTPLCFLKITQHPQSAEVPAGQRASFSVGAEGLPGPTLYQWVRSVAGGPPMPIPGADGPVYTTPPLNPPDSNSAFACFVSNGCANAMSQPAFVFVFGPQASQ